MSITTLILGRPIANDEAHESRIGVLEGVPAMGLDGLGSAAYGPEAALAILAVAGPQGVAVFTPITWAIVALLALLTLSYWQTIAAYPNNGGSYAVARDNLGERAGLLAAAALMLDYLLNVAVGISAGVGALVSALPALHPYTLPICLGILLALTLVNLRGTRETGLLLSIPTYLFMAGLGGTLAWGLVHGGARLVPPPAPTPHTTTPIGLWLLLRAFASGCTAMTGVEAVSNGVGAFRKPVVRNAHGTLLVITLALGVLLLGIGTLARLHGVQAMDQAQTGYRSVLSQLVEAVCGRGWCYNMVIGSALCVLCLSANTSFVGFPRLCRLVAKDGYLPHGFALPGRRLVYFVGVLVLAAGAGALLVGFDGITDRLIPLFAVGAFLSFTLSQAGMAWHWRRQSYAQPGAHTGKKLVNGLGALATGLALAIIVVAKFTEGAWLSVVVIGVILLLLRAVHRHYQSVDRQMLHGSHRRIDAARHQAPRVIVPIARWDRMARKAVEYALRLSPDVTALHVLALEGPDAEEHSRALRQDWQRFVTEPAEEAGLPAPALELAQSRYRSVIGPLLRHVQAVAVRDARPVLVVLPELVEGAWWAGFLHVHRERRLHRQLMRQGGPDIAVVSVPWQLHPAPAKADPEPAAKRDVLASEQDGGNSA